MTKETVHPGESESEENQAKTHSDSRSGMPPGAPSDAHVLSDSSRFRIVRQRGAGRDGAAFEAVDLSTGESVELHRIGRAMVDPSRKEAIVSRLRLLESIRHPTILSVRDFSLDSDPPFVCLEWGRGETLAEIELDETRRLSLFERLRIASQVCEAVVASHQLGLAHGQLGTRSIRVDGDRVRLDFSGLQTTSSPQHSNQADSSADSESALAKNVPSPGGGSTIDVAADVPALAQVLEGLLTYADVAKSLNGLSGRRHAALRQLIRLASTGEPHLRPLAHEFLDLLQQLEALGVAQATSHDEPAGGENSAATAEIVAPPFTQDATVEQDISPTGDADLKGELEGGAATFGAPVSPGRQLPQAGEQLGRYNIVKKIGEGGMGAVFKATDIGNGRIVAIKTLKSTSTITTNALIRFHKEGRMLAAVNNPFVTNLIEVNQDDGLHYIVLEFVDGIDVKRVLEKLSPLPERQAIAIAADVARALVDAHDRGIVHRDIDLQVPRLVRHIIKITIRIGFFQIHSRRNDSALNRQRTHGCFNSRSRAHRVP